MKRGHSKELNEILTSKSHILERYGILILISVLTLIMIVLHNYECKEQLLVKKVEKVSVNNDSVYRITILGEQTSQAINYKKLYLIKGEKRVKCENLTEFSINGKYIMCKLSNREDDKILDIIQSSSGQDIYIETSQKYFDIIVSPFFNLIQK